MDESTLRLGAFSVQFTGMIVFWNHCELSARQILQHLLGEGEPSMAIAAEIQNRSLTNALRSIARSAQFEAFQDRLEHFCKGYDTLLAYRNHYVHSLMGTEGGKGGLLSLSAKGTLQYCKETIETAHLVNLTNSLQQLVAYGAALQRDLGATGRGLMNLLTAYEALPETPQWPKTLQKPQRLIRAPKPPPRP